MFCCAVNLKVYLEVNLEVNLNRLIVSYSFNCKSNKQRIIFTGFLSKAALVYTWS